MADKLRGEGIIPNEFVDKRTPYTQFQVWLGETGGAIGCPVDCQYCFFQLDGLTPVKPREGLTPQELVEELGNASTYAPNIPVNYGSETDAFATRKNVAYYSEVLQRYGASDYPNPVVFISKREIPDQIMDLAAEIPQPVLFYMSYSGLGDTPLEPTVRSEVIRDNFIRLKEHDLTGVHYWRPFLPQNSTPEKIEEVLSHVAEYASCSVAIGLRLNDGIQANIADFWPELGASTYDFTKTGEFWPEDVRGYLMKYTKQHYPDYPVFFGTTPCSATFALETSDIRGAYRSSGCLESNCPPFQRERCGAAFATPTEEQIQAAAEKMDIAMEDISLIDNRITVRGKIESGKLVYLRYALKYPVISEAVGYAAGYNWANVRDEGRIIEIPWRDNWIKAAKNRQLGKLGIHDLGL